MPHGSSGATRHSEAIQRAAKWQRVSQRQSAESQGGELHRCKQMISRKKKRRNFHSYYSKLKQKVQQISLAGS